MIPRKNPEKNVEEIPSEKGEDETDGDKRGVKISDGSSSVGRPNSKSREKRRSRKLTELKPYLNNDADKKEEATEPSASNLVKSGLFRSKETQLEDSTDDNGERSTAKPKRKLDHGLLFAVIVISAGSGFQHGYNTGVINAPQKLIKDWIFTVSSNRTDLVWEHEHVTFIWSVIVSMFCLGGLLGASLTRLIADTLGRKRGLLLNNFLIYPGALVEGFSKNVGSYKMLIVGRLFVGINSGLNAGLATMYVSEVAPVYLRGALGTVYQLCIVSSILLSQILGLETVLGTEEFWPYLFGCILIPAGLQLITLPFCPESPKFLYVEKGNEEVARQELKRLRRTYEEVDEEMEQMTREREDLLTRPKVSLKDMIYNSSYRMPLIISIVLMMGQQFSGINAVLYFSTSIFQFSKFSHRYAQYGTIGVGATIVLVTIITIFIMDKLGRKPLLLFGFGGMCVVVILLTIGLAFADKIIEASYTCIFLIFLFVAFFASGPGSIPWLIAPELFSQSARALAVAIAVSVNWIANFVIGIGFLPTQELIGAYVFIVFFFLLAFFFLFTLKRVPETKNKTIEEITAIFRQANIR